MPSALQVVRAQWLPALAAAGLVASLVVASSSRRALGAGPAGAASAADAPATPGRPPYRDYIAGAGLVESARRDVRVAAPVGALVEAVAVRVGDRVRAGAPLFTLDRRTTAAEVATRAAALDAARARVGEQRAALAEARDQRARVEAVDDPRAVSGDDLAQRRANVALAEARLRSAAADVASRAAELAAARAADAQRVVRAPRDDGAPPDGATAGGAPAFEVLEVTVRPGEFAAAGVGDAPVRLGGADRLQVRVDVDENDAWRLRPGARAHLYLRGNPALQADLRYEYVERYVRPKTSLTGASTERVDTRVLQVVYSFPAGALPVYVGQQVDVVIEVPAGAPAPAGRGGR